MIGKFLRRLLDSETPVKSDLQTLIEFQRESNAHYNEHISNLINTLDKIVTAKFDRPVVTEVKPNAISSPLPQDSLSDVLYLDSDEDFIAKSQELLN